MLHLEMPEEMPHEEAPSYGRGRHQREAVPYGSVSKEINRKIRDGEAPPLKKNADVRAFAKSQYEAAGLPGEYSRPLVAMMLKKPSVSGVLWVKSEMPLTDNTFTTKI